MTGIGMAAASGATASNPSFPITASASWSASLNYHVTGASGTTSAQFLGSASGNTSPYDFIWRKDGGFPQSSELSITALTSQNTAISYSGLGVGSSYNIALYCDVTGQQPGSGTSNTVAVIITRDS